MTISEPPLEGGGYNGSTRLLSDPSRIRSQITSMGNMCSWKEQNTGGKMSTAPGGEIKRGERDGPRALIGSGLDGLNVGIAVAQAASARRTTERLMVVRIVDG